MNFPSYLYCLLLLFCQNKWESNSEKMDPNIDYAVKIFYNLNCIDNFNDFHSLHSDYTLFNVQEFSKIDEKYLGQRPLQVNMGQW